MNMILSRRNRFIHLLLPLLVGVLVSLIVASNVVSATRRVQPAFTLTMMGARRGKGGNLSECFCKCNLAKYLLSLFTLYILH